VSVRRIWIAGAALAGAVTIVSLIVWVERHSDATLGRWASVATIVSAALAVPTLIVGLWPLISRRGLSANQAETMRPNEGREARAVAIQDSASLSPFTESDEIKDPARRSSIPPAKLHGASVEEAAVLIFPTSNKKLWTELYETLEHVEFDDSSWRALAAKTGILQKKLELQYPPHPTADREIKGYLNDLSRILSESLKPSATPAQLHAACLDADRVREWLLDLLHEPRL
jgi:hypothetical protein